MRFLFIGIGLLALAGVTFAQGGNAVTKKEKDDLFALVKMNKDVRNRVNDAVIAQQDIAKSFAVKKVDLNRDGKPEYITTLNDEVLCGAHANCPSWVFEKSSTGYSLILSVVGQELKQEKTVTNQFDDLRSGGSDTATESAFAIYKFDGSEYKAIDCFKVTATAGSDKTKTARIPCSQMNDDH